MPASLQWIRLGRRLLHDVRNTVEDKRWPGWGVVIGVESHAQLKSHHKLFSDACIGFKQSSPANTFVDLFDAALPGTLPKLNHKCVDLALRTAIALNSDIQRSSSFDRKHYFYSDLPSGYQITQQYAPIARGGNVLIKSHKSCPIPIRIKQIQLEQDTAKSTFNLNDRTTLIDLNRAGSGLMEIVSEPDIRSPEEAAAYVRALRSILRCIGASDGNMEQGSLRCDVNVSIHRIGQPWGTRCEIKNLNSVRFMTGAIIHEINRHRALLSSSKVVVQETRGFNENTYETFRLRPKEDAPDYRYMPEPNLGVLFIEEDRIQHIRQTLPELPWKTRERLKVTYGLNDHHVDALLAIDKGRDIPFDGAARDEIDDLGAVAYFDRLCQGSRDPKVVINWMTHELLGQLAIHNEAFTSRRIPYTHFGELIDLVQSGTITGTSGKMLLRHMLNNPSPASPSQLVSDMQLQALSSAAAVADATGSAALPDLRSLCSDAIIARPKEAEAVRAGYDSVINKLVGHVMKVCRGRADARSVKTLLKEMLHADRS